MIAINAKSNMWLLIVNFLCVTDKTTFNQNAKV